MSGPIELTSKILKEIRDELREHRGVLHEHTGVLHEHTAILREHGQELRGIRADMRVQNERMELIETTLRDLAEQIVMLTRGVKVAIESRARDDSKLEDHERRITALEAATSEG